MEYILDIYVVNTKRFKSDNLKPLYGIVVLETHMSKQVSLGSFDLESYETCESCLSRKMTKSPFTGKGERAIALLEVIHSDVYGPMNTHARGGFSYFVTIIDDYS